MTPQPGTGCLTVNPQFTNPSLNDFSIPASSQLCGTGKYNHDYGARMITNIPDRPAYFEINNSESTDSLYLKFAPPQVNVFGDSLDTLQTLQLFRNDQLAMEFPITNLQDTLLYIDQISKADYYKYSLSVKDTAQNQGRFLYSANQWVGGSMQGIVIWELDPTPTSSQALKTEMMNLGMTEQEIYISTYGGRYELTDDIHAVFVCLGMENNDHVLAESEGQKLKDYLDAGGNLYMEGGVTWYNATMTPVHSYFYIYSVGDGSATPNLANIAGTNGTPFDGMYFAYQGESFMVDQIEPALSSATEIFSDPGLNEYENGLTIANNGGFFRTIGCSFEFGGLVDGTSPSTKQDVLKLYLQFFGILPSSAQSEELQI